MGGEWTGPQRAGHLRQREVKVERAVGSWGGSRRALGQPGWQVRGELYGVLCLPDLTHGTLGLCFFIDRWPLPEWTAGCREPRVTWLAHTLPGLAQSWSAWAMQLCIWAGDLGYRGVLGGGQVFPIKTQGGMFPGPWALPPARLSPTSPHTSPGQGMAALTCPRPDQGGEGDLATSLLRSTSGIPTPINSLAVLASAPNAGSNTHQPPPPGSLPRLARSSLILAPWPLTPVSTLA